MPTRLDTECEFVYNLTLTETKHEFDKLIKSASDEQIAALIETLINCDIFFLKSSSFKCANLFPPSRQQLVKQRKNVQNILRAVFCEILKCEFAVMTLTEDSE